MSKQKVRKAVAKRVKVTAKGKIAHHKPGRSHLMSSKSGKRRRGLRRKTVLSGAQEKNARRQLGLA